MAFPSDLEIAQKATLLPIFTIAERLGVEPFTLQRVEEGLELPPNPRKMARVYGVSRMELAAAARRVVS